MFHDFFLKSAWIALSCVSSTGIHGFCEMQLGEVLIYTVCEENVTSESQMIGLIEKVESHVSQ